MCSEVTGLQHEVEEKEMMLNTLATDLITRQSKFQKSFEQNDNKISKLEAENSHNTKRIEELKDQIKEKSEVHKVEMDLLRRKLEEVNENFELQSAKDEIAENEMDILQKLLISFGMLPTTIECCEKLKNPFISIGAFSSEKNLLVEMPLGW